MSSLGQCRLPLHPLQAQATCYVWISSVKSLALMVYGSQLDITLGGGGRQQPGPERRAPTGWTGNQMAPLNLLRAAGPPGLSPWLGRPPPRPFEPSLTSGLSRPSQRVSAAPGSHGARLHYLHYCGRLAGRYQNGTVQGELWQRRLCLV